MAVTVTFEPGVSFVKELRSRAPIITTRLRQVSPLADTPLFGIGPNTWPGLRDSSVPPSEIYQAWAISVLDRFGDLLPRLSDLQTQDDFELWHAGLLQDFVSAVPEDFIEGRSCGHVYKLIDLFVKWLATTDLGLPKWNELILRFAHAPLDSVVLTAINEAYGRILPLGNPTMGHIRSDESYFFCQSLVRDVAVAAGTCPLVFDTFAAGRYGAAWATS